MKLQYTNHILLSIKIVICIYFADQVGAKTLVYF